MKFLAIYQVFIITCLLYAVINGQYKFKTKLEYGLAWGSLLVFPFAYIFQLLLGK